MDFTSVATPESCSEMWENNDDIMLEDVDLDVDIVELDDDFFDDCFEQQASNNHVDTPEQQFPSERTTAMHSEETNLDRTPSAISDLLIPMNTTLYDNHGCTSIDQIGEKIASCHKQMNSTQDTKQMTQFQFEYSCALNNLASSMRRSELTRSEILRQRQNSDEQQPRPTPQALSGLAGLLSGRSSTLTVALGQSRKQLKSFVEVMHQTSPI
eukprot:CAMPEP_0194354594 /NCGR_PEP_ID=MMETSP0174-20130528/2714_1 /TAXON_ID=216777 /ORGANISM="Proboscia alata, Strain PI-D3" /LENGTH=211 /DNA_ID=CAMNT_0039123597 /DNA_START=33 /DNA_END=668 /DNA_ORIENTATION=+